MGKTTIRIGDRFGKVVVIAKAGKLRDKPHRTVYECLCDCGNTKLIDAGNLRKPGPRSCGCERRRLAVEKGKKQRTEHSYVNFLFGERKRDAGRRNMKFSLSLCQFWEIITKPCHYCGSEPKMKGLTKVGIEIPTNGVDRVNNSLGYVLKNCVTCCKICNTMKLNLHVLDFLKHIEKINSRIRMGIFNP